jgi:hypothetical protein
MPFFGLRFSPFALHGSDSRLSASFRFLSGSPSTRIGAMNSAPFLEYFVAALNVVSVALLLCGGCLVLGCQFLGVAGRRGDTEGMEGRNHSREVT